MPQPRLHGGQRIRSTFRRRPTRISRRRATTCCSSSTPRVCPRLPRSSRCPLWCGRRAAHAAVGPQASALFGSATVTWSASADNIGVTIYRIYRSVVSGFHARDGDLCRGINVHDVHERPDPLEHLLLQDHGRGRRWQRERAVERGVGLRAGRHDAADGLDDGAGRDGASVSGSIVVSANATDGVSTPRVLFKLDGQPLGNSIIAPPYSITWDSTTTSNGVHTLSAVATDRGRQHVRGQRVGDGVESAASAAGLVAAYGFNEAAGARSPTRRARATAERFRRHVDRRPASSAARSRSTGPARGSPSTTRHRSI